MSLGESGVQMDRGVMWEKGAEGPKVQYQGMVAS